MNQLALNSLFQFKETKSINLKNILQQYFLSNQNQQIEPSQIEWIATVNNQRANITDGKSFSSLNISLCESYSKNHLDYLNSLKLLTKMQKHKCKNLLINSEWTNTFDKQFYQHYSLCFEKLNLCYNISVLYYKYAILLMLEGKKQEALEKLRNALWAIDSCGIKYNKLRKELHPNLNDINPQQINNFKEISKGIAYTNFADLLEKQAPNSPDIPEIYYFIHLIFESISSEKLTMSIMIQNPIDIVSTFYSFYGKTNYYFFEAQFQKGQNQIGYAVSYLNEVQKVAQYFKQKQQSLFGPIISFHKQKLSDIITQSGNLYADWKQKNINIHKKKELATNEIDNLCQQKIDMIVQKYAQKLKPKEPEIITKYGAKNQYLDLTNQKLDWKKQILTLKEKREQIKENFELEIFIWNKANQLNKKNKKKIQNLDNLQKKNFKNGINQLIGYINCNNDLEKQCQEIFKNESNRKQNQKLYQEYATQSQLFRQISIEFWKNETIFRQLESFKVINFAEILIKKQELYYNKTIGTNKAKVMELLQIDKKIEQLFTDCDSKTDESQLEKSYNSIESELKKYESIGKFLYQFIEVDENFQQKLTQVETLENMNNSLQAINSTFSKIYKILGSIQDQQNEQQIEQNDIIHSKLEIKYFADGQFQQGQEQRISPKPGNKQDSQIYKSELLPQFSQNSQK